VTIKTLIVLTPGFPRDESDSTCIPFLQTHLLALKRSKPELEIVVLSLQYPFQKKKYIWNGIEVIAFGGQSKGKIYRLMIWLKAWRTLAKLNRKKNIAGVFSIWLTECALIGHSFAKRHNLRHKIWVVGQDAKKENKYIGRIRPEAEELVVISDFLASELEKNHRISPGHKIPFGVEKLQPANDQVHDIDILGAGSLIPLKQYDVFIDLVSDLVNEFPHLKACICGEGSERENLVKKIASNKMQDHISILGELPHAEILELMKRSRIFLHTSNYEGLGLVCLEALSAGAHVISFTKPFNFPPPGWEYAKNIKDMQAKINAYLKGDHEASASIPYQMEEAVSKLAALFDI
jgi:glycosyltransferase involved in cell wall biosynthesis